MRPRLPSLCRHTSARRSALSLSLLSLLSLSSCSSRAPAPAHERAQPLRLPSVRFDPGDLTTRVATDALRVYVDHARKLDPQAVSSLASAVTLRTWPRLEPVEATVTSLDAGAEHAAALVIQPTAATSDRWYVLHVASLPPAFAWQEHAPLLRLPDGAMVARFRAGSEPVLSAIQVCGDDDHPAVLLQLSERVVSDGPLDAIVGARQGDAAVCHPTEARFADAGSSSVALRCAGVDLRSILDVTLASGLRAPANGRALSPLHFRFTPTDQPIVSPGCRAYRP